MNFFVIDTSVAIKWFIPEIHADSAVEYLDQDNSLNVPDLLFPEFGNTLWKKVGRQELKQEEARSIVAALNVVPLHIHESSPLLESALELSLNTGCTVYDSLYVALAISLDCSLITADERLFRLFQTTPFADNLTILENR